MRTARLCLSNTRQNVGMATLEHTLRADLTTAMRSGDDTTTRTLRMILTAISTAQTSGTQLRELTDEDERRLLASELKRRREAAEAFTSAGRSELADAELAEAEVIQRYLPEPMQEAELDELVSAAVSGAESAGLTGGRAMGVVMKELKPLTQGRVDGAELAAKVKAALGLGA